MRLKCVSLHYILNIYASYYFINSTAVIKYIHFVNIILKYTNIIVLLNRYMLEFISSSFQNTLASKWLHSNIEFKRILHPVLVLVM